MLWHAVAEMSCVQGGKHAMLAAAAGAACSALQSEPAAAARCAVLTTEQPCKLWVNVRSDTHVVAGRL